MQSYIKINIYGAIVAVGLNYVRYNIKFMIRFGHNILYTHLNRTNTPFFLPFRPK